MEGKSRGVLVPELALPPNSPWSIRFVLYTRVGLNRLTPHLSFPDRHTTHTYIHTYPHRTAPHSSAQQRTKHHSSIHTRAKPQFWICVLFGSFVSAVAELSFSLRLITRHCLLAAVHPVLYIIILFVPRGLGYRFCPSCLSHLIVRRNPSI